MKYINAVCCGLLMLLLESCFVNSCENNARRTITKEVFTGRIVKKYVDKKDRGRPHIIINGNDFFVAYSIYEQLQVNDSIIKNKGTLKHIVIRDNDTLELYPVCGGWLLIMDDTVMSLR